MSTAILLTVSGVLDSRSYLSLRDTIIKAALDDPSAVIVDITDLEAPTESALAVFTSARWHISRWPDIPLILVCRHESGRVALQRNGITRYVPVFTGVEDAIADLPGDCRRRARAELPADPGSARLARELITEWLTGWGRTELLPVVKIVVTVLVENAVQYSHGAPRLRVESKDDQVTVAVEDDSSAPAVIREGRPGSQELTSLKLVDALCKAWGSSPIPTGKAVWGVIVPEKRP